MVLEARGGPYRQTNQSGGELPSKIPDIPLSIVLLVVFMVAGGSHMFLLIRNKKRGHKFLVNGMVFGLCNVRIFTFCLRTAWALHPTSIRLGIASTIFVYAGTILLWMANLLFAQRLVRAQHPRFGWSKPVTLVFPILCAIIVLTLLMLIVTVIQQFYTESTNTHRIDRDFQLYAQTCYAIMAFLPIPIVLISTAAGSLPSVIASRQHTPVDKFGKGRITHKINLILFSAVFLALGAGFRCGTTWKQPVPSHTPTGELVAQPWYYTKAAFYSFNFGIELIVVFAWLIFRIDQMFHIPDGAVGSYKLDRQPQQPQQHHVEKPRIVKPMPGSDSEYEEPESRQSMHGSQVSVLHAYGPTTYPEYPPPLHTHMYRRDDEDEV